MDQLDLAREGFVTVQPGLRLWYRRAGEGPPLLFLNGVGVTTTFWEPIAERFARAGFTTVLWDYLGHGRSEAPRSPEAMTLARCAADLRALLDALELPRVCLIGHSMGAQLAFEFFHQNRDRVSGLVPTLGTYRDPLASFFELPRVSSLIFEAGDALATAAPGLIRRAAGIASLRPELSDRLVRRLRIIHPELSPSAWLGGYLDHMAKLDPRVFFALLRSMRAQDASALLPEIDVPVLVVSGERDRFCPPKVAAEMSRRIPHAEHLSIPGGSHAAILEQPDLLALRLERFLRARVYGA